jgi:hypothetical protein
MPSRHELYERLKAMADSGEGDREAAAWAVEEIHKLWVFVAVCPPPPHREDCCCRHCRRSNRVEERYRDT